MTTRSFISRRFATKTLLALFLSGTVATALPLSQALAQTMTDTSRVTRAVGHYDAVISRASSLYHKTLADARKRFDQAKGKADAAYDKATERANREVTLKINTVKEEVAQSSGFDAHLKDKIKGAAKDFAVAIARARAIRQEAVASALREYTETLRKATSDYADVVKKAESVYRTEAKRWIQ